MRVNDNPTLAERTLSWLILITVSSMVMFSGWKIGIIIDKYNKGVYNNYLPKSLIKKVEQDESV